MDNVELVKQGYKDFAEGNIEAVLAVFVPEFEWHGSVGFPYLEGDGVVVGANEVAQKVFAQIPSLYDNFSIDIQDIFESGDKVVMEGFYRGAWKATGKEFKANAAHIWTVKEGKAIKCMQAVDTAEIMKP